MNVMFVANKKPDPTRCFTEKFGTHQCTLQVRENLLREHGIEPPEKLVNQVLRFGSADMDAAYLKTITDTAKEYTGGIFHRLQEHSYDSRLMKLYVVGGGGALIKNFAEYEPDRVTINSDICATAKGYERIAEMKLLRGNKP